MNKLGGFGLLTLLVLFGLLTTKRQRKPVDADMRETTNQDSLRAFIFGRKRKNFPWD